MWLFHRTEKKAGLQEQKSVLHTNKCYTPKEKIFFWNKSDLYTHTFCTQKISHSIITLKNFIFSLEITVFVNKIINFCTTCTFCVQNELLCEKIINFVYTKRIFERSRNLYGYRICECMRMGFDLFCFLPVQSEILNGDLCKTKIGD